MSVLHKIPLVVKCEMSWEVGTLPIISGQISSPPNGEGILMCRVHCILLQIVVQTGQIYVMKNLKKG